MEYLEIKMNLIKCKKSSGCCAYFKIIWMFSCLFSTHILWAGTAQDFSTIMFDLEDTQAVINAVTSSGAEVFVAGKIEAPLQLLRDKTFKPGAYDKMIFLDALSAALGVASTHPLGAAALKTRITTVKTKMDAYNAGQDPFAGDAPVSTVVPFVVIRDFVNEKLKTFKQTKSTLTPAGAETLANDLFAAVKREAPGIVDSATIATVKSNLNSIKGDLGVDKKIAADKLVAAMQYLDNIPMNDRMDFLDRIYSLPDDRAFEAGAGEQRFLSVASFIDTKFDSLTQEDKDDFQGFLAEARSNSDYSSMTKNTVGTIINKRWGNQPVASEPITITQGFVDLKKFLTDRNTEILAKTRTGATAMTKDDAKKFATAVQEAVEVEVPGFVEAKDTSLVTLSLDSIIGSAKKLKYSPTAGATAVASFGPEELALFDKAKLAAKEITLSDRIDYLSRITDSSDLVFAPGEGETRFLKVVDYVVGKFTSLSQDDRGDLLAVVSAGSERADFSDRTKSSLASTLESPIWYEAINNTSTSTIGSNTISTSAVSWQNLTPTEIRSTVRITRTELSDKLVSLGKDEYIAFLDKYELLLTMYRHLIKIGNVVLEPAAGSPIDGLIAEVQALAKTISENHRWKTAAEDIKARVADLYNVAFNNLSIDQKIDDYKLDQAAVNNDTKALAFVQKIKQDLIVNSDGSLKPSFTKIAEDDKKIIAAYIRSLKNDNSGFFGAASEELESLESLISSGLSIDQMLSGLSEKFTKVNTTKATKTETAAFVQEVKDFYAKFKDQRLKRNVTEAQRTNFTELLKKTLLKANANFRLLDPAHGLQSMLTEVQNPLSFATIIAGISADLVRIKNEPDSVDGDYLAMIHALVVDLIKEWQYSRCIGLADVANNTALVTLLDSLAASDDFFSYKNSDTGISEFTAMKQQIQGAITQSDKIDLILGYLKKVLEDAAPAPKLIENFVKSSELLVSAVELAKLTQLQRDDLKAKLIDAKDKTFFDAINKKKFDDALAKIAVAGVAPAASAATTPVQAPTALGDLTGVQAGATPVTPASAPVATTPTIKPRTGVATTRGTSSELALQSNRSQSGQRTSSVQGLPAVSPATIKRRVSSTR